MSHASSNSPEPPEFAYEGPDPERPASATPTEPLLESEARAAGHDPYAAIRFRDFRLFAVGNLVSVTGTQMLSVAVGWQLYQLTGSATALGLVGFVQALPTIFLAIPAGQVADRVNRKGIVLVSQLLTALCALGLALLSIRQGTIPGAPFLLRTNRFLLEMAHWLGEPSCRFNDPAIPLVYGALVLHGVARTFNGPARAALLPQIVPLWAFSNAVTWNTSGFQVASMAGPALGGLLIGRWQSAPSGFALVYLIDGICAVSFFSFMLPIVYRAEARAAESVTLAALTAGIGFVWRTKIILATITLDLFAVLLGGATALLPMFAQDRLHVGPVGLGWLRTAPALGAFATALLLAHLPPMQRAGRTLLWAVAGFGAATVVFGLSRSFWLSLTMLCLTGAFDNVSVVVRHTLVQILTPDAMRGRVAAVNNVFIGSSNELGALESGMTAALFGPVISVVAGGLGTILIVLLAARIWPEVRRFGALQAAEHG